MGEMEGTYNPRERYNLEDPAVSGRIIFKRIFK